MDGERATVKRYGEEPEEDRFREYRKEKEQGGW